MSKTTANPLDLEALDRLEDKVKRLVRVVEQLRSERARLADANEALTRELEDARSQARVAESASAELTALRAEREQVRTRVTDLLEQLDGLEL